MKLFWLTLAIVVAGSGCATRTDYLSYKGGQQNWPTSPGAFTSTHNGITIYHGYPSQPYNVLGRISQVNGTDQSLSWIAKQNGADGVIITGGKDIYATSFGTNAGPNAVTGWAIRIRTNIVLDLQPVTTP